MESNRILIIDDDIEAQNTYKNIFTPLPTVKPKKQFALAIASQGEEGLSIIKKSLEDKNPFTVTFIDVRMPPGWDGIKTASEIRNIDPDIEIVIVTAYTDKTLDEIIEIVGKPEKLFYINKPIVGDEIWQLGNALNEKWNLQKKERFYLNLFQRWNDELTERIKERTWEIEDINHKLKKAQAHLIQIAKAQTLCQVGVNIAREINGPLSEILGNMQILLSKLDRFPENKDAFKKNLGLIDKETRRCKILIENLLKFAERPTHQHEPLVLNNLIGETTDLLANELKTNNVELSLTLPGEPISAFGDANQIQQALMNIIFNSIQAMPEGGKLDITLTLKTENEAQIKIADTGNGILEQDLPRIFEPLFTTKQEYPCIGLGLTIAYQIIKGLKGDVLVESLIGRGTTVTLTLPALKE